MSSIGPERLLMSIGLEGECLGVDSTTSHIKVDKKSISGLFILLQEGSRNVLRNILCANSSKELKNR
jgi:hypothetical protein